MSTVHPPPAPPEPSLAERLGLSGAHNVALWDKLISGGSDLLVNLMTAMLILAVTLWLARWADRLTRMALGRVHPRKGPADPTLQVFVASLARNAVIVLGAIAVLQQLGVKTTSIIAAVSAASLAIGLAMQGALSNVAAGVMIFLFRPYRVGDIIETGGKVGRVRSLDLFLTELATLDNLKIAVPNAKVFGDVIVDHTAHERRRADVPFHLPQAVDPLPILRRLMQRLEADPRVLKDHAPLLEITALTEGFTEIYVRPWVHLADYGPMKADILLWTRMLLADPQANLPAAAGWGAAADHPPAAAAEAARDGL